MFSKSELFVSGQSLFEVVLVLALFSLMAASFISLTLGSVSSVSYGTDFLAAGTFADEGVGATRAIRDNAWNTLTDGVESATLDNRFNRTITINPIDLQTKFLKVEVTWPSPVGVTQKVKRQTYLTNWDSRDWIQTDWSGGQYASIDSTIDTNTIGQVQLKARPFFWTPVVSPVTQTLNSVACRSVNDCWAIGNPITTGPSAGRGELILHWNGSVWARIGPSTVVPDVNLNSVFCLAGSECWAIGNISSGEVILRNVNGTTWTRYPISNAVPDVNLNSIFCLTTSDCWAVGSISAGEVTVHWNGVSWSRIGPSASAPNVVLNSISCVATNNCFAAGASGNIIKWDGTNWNPSATISVQAWNEVFMISAANAFVVGAGGAIRRWNGVDWNTTYAAGTNAWYEIEMTSATDGLAVGAAGASRHFDGSTWSPIVSNTTQAINSLFLISPRAGWAVGAGGIILTLTGGGYETFGVLTSPVFDMSNASPVQIIGWDEQIPVCSPVCSVKFQIRVADNPAMTGAVWSSDFIAAAGTLINPSYNGQRWVQYRATLAGDGNSTPILSEVRINYK